MSADAVQDVFQDDVSGGILPPPGFEESDGRPGAPEKPPVPSFGDKSRVRGETWSNRADGGSQQGRSYWDHSEKDAYGSVHGEATRDEWQRSGWSRRDGDDAQLRGSGWDNVRRGEDHPGWGRCTSWDANVSTAPGSIPVTMPGNLARVIHGRYMVPELERRWPPSG